MSDHIARTIADLKARRDSLNSVIEALERVASVGISLPPIVAVAPSVSRTPDKSTGGGRRKPAPARSVERRPRANADLDDAGELGARILAAIQAGATNARDMRTRLKLPIGRINKALQVLAANGQIHATSAGRHRRWHLGAKGAGRLPAKEAP